jgi:hypothetical protein
MEQISNLPMVDINDLQVSSPNGFIVDVSGNCMDSDKSPMRAKDGDSILVHPVRPDTETLLRYLNKLICVRFDETHFLLKELCGFFEHLGTIRVCCYNPDYHAWDIPLRRIKGFYVVDAVLSPDYIKSHTK